MRPLRPDEYQQAGAVTAGAYLEYEPVARGWDRWGQYLQELADVVGRSRHVVVLGAVDGGQVLGTVTVEIDRDVDGVPRAPAEPAHLRMLAVDPAARRRGVARALVTQAIEVARASGRNEMILPTTPYMKAGHPLYEEVGFRRTRDRDISDETGRAVVLLYRLQL
ncbi:MAG: GNAT family N-acetyltransferase [Frankiaceae bacterium]